MRFRLVCGLTIGCVLAALCPAQQLDTVLYFPDSLGFCYLPNTVFANPRTDRVYVANGGDVSGTLIFDPASRTKSGFVRKYSHGAVYCPGPHPKVYLLGEYELTVMDARTDLVLRTVPTEFYPTQGFYNAHNDRLYFTDADEGSVVVYDPDEDTTVTTIDVGVSPTTAVLDPIADRIFCASEGEVVAVVDCYGDSVMAYLAVGEEPVTALAMDTTGRRVYCATEADTLYTLDPDSLAVVGARGDVHVGGQMLFNEAYGRLYFPSGESLVIYDCAGDSVRRRLPLPYVQGLCLNEQSGRVYAAPYNTPGVAVIDAGDTVVTTISTADMGLPLVLGYGSGRDELYCAMQYDTVAIVNGGADTLVGFVDYTQYVIRGVVHNPVENKLYLVLPDRDEVMVLDRDYRLTATIPVPMRRLSVFPLFNPGLNRLYLADSEQLWVIDCYRDSLLGGRTVTGLEQASTALLVRSLGKAYIFPKYVTVQHGAWVYDCLRDTVTTFIPLAGRVGSAVYHPWTNCVYVSVNAVPSVAVIDASADTLVAGISAGHDYSYNKLFANQLDGRVYHAINTGRERLITIDVRTNTVTDSVEIFDDADTIFWYSRQNRLYLCDRAAAGDVKVFDCNTGRVTATLDLPCYGAGAMNEATERLYLGDGDTLLVLDCRYNELVVALPLPDVPRLSAVSTMDNRVYFADRSNWLAVVQDRLGVEEEGRSLECLGLALVSNPVRTRAAFRCQLPAGEHAELVVYDASGRRVNRISAVGTGQRQYLVWPRTDAGGRTVANGVYFARLESGTRKETAKVILE